MANRITVTEEMRALLANTQSAEQVAEVFASAGKKINQKDAKRLSQEIQHHITDQELSLAELEAVSGGSERNYLEDGCAATVEPGSYCWGTDMCDWVNCTYDNWPASYCKKCGAVVINKGADGGYWHYECTRCHDTFTVPVDLEFDV